jgi:hypothetical protein
MNPDASKLKHNERTEQEQLQTEEIRTKDKEFASVEELLRYDSEQNPVPPEVAERLSQAVAAESKPTQPWYKKLFGG